MEGEFASWSVLPARTQPDGREREPSSIVLPLDVLTSLLFTLPRMLQAALDERLAAEARRTRSLPARRRRRCHRWSTARCVPALQR